MTSSSPPTTSLPQRIGSAVRRLWPGFTWRSTALWIIIVVNVVLAALYFWSRGGSTTEVLIEARGEDYRVFVDGKLTVSGTYADAPSQGGIGITLPGARSVPPSLPGPTGLDDIRVTDLDSGEVLFEDDFDGELSPMWQVRRGEFVTEDGVLKAARDGHIATEPQDWDDYAVRATFRNVTEASIYVHEVNAESGVIFSMRPYRHHNYHLRLEQEDTPPNQIGASHLVVDDEETLKSITGILLRPYPVVVLLVLGFTAFAFAVRVPEAERLIREAGSVMYRQAGRIAAGLAGGTLIILGYLIYVVGDAIPKVPDSTLYVFQSKIYASFRLTADAPPSQESFAIFSNPPFLQVVDGRWFSHYNFGHPMFLAVGQLFGAPWVIPPILGAASVALIFAIGKRVYSTPVGLLAAVVLMFSPFFQMTGSNFMSHNTALFTILGLLFLFTRPFKNHLLSMFAAGILLGLLFNIRPLSAVAFIPVLGGFMGYELLRADDRVRQLREGLAFSAGAVLMLLAYFGYNQATTGDFLTSPYALQGTYGENWFGFSGRHSLDRGLQNQEVLLSLFVLVVNGWPVAIGLALAAMPFVLGTRHRWDYFFIASAVVLAGVNIFYINPAIMHGPRFWYETMGFVILLTARGAWSLKDAAIAAADQFARSLNWRPSASSEAATTAAVTCLVLALVAYSMWGWMLERREAWSDIDFMPSQMSELEGFNHVDRRLLDLADDMDIEHALIFVEECAGWWCYGSEFWANSIGLDSNIVWADRHYSEADLITLNYYDDRDLYLADYRAETIEEISRAEIRRTVAEATADDGPGVVTDTRSLEERDAARREDLEGIRQLLAGYREREGSYPSTNAQLQSLCRYDYDAGCQLKEFTVQLPADPQDEGGSRGYWYVSDGASFTLIALQETLEPDAAHVCPDVIKASLQSIDRLYCIFP